MARFLSGKIRVSGFLKAIDALHIGSGEGDHLSDMTVAIDGRDRCYVPGTGLTGALREWCSRRFEASLVDIVFGYQRKDRGSAAYLQVEDALIRDTAEQCLTADHLEIRDHVGIDDQFGTAIDGIKFDRAVLPPGCHLDFSLTLELDALHPEKSQQAQAVLGHLLAGLTGDGIRIGAARTRGLGRIQLTTDSLKIQPEAFSKAGIVQRLTGTLNSVSVQDLCDLDPNTKPRDVPRMRLTINWTAELPTMIKSGTDGLLVDTLPLLGGRDEQLAPLIPASSIKGCLRQRAELIIRTLLDVDPEWTTSTGRDRFHRQLDEPLPLIQELFGSRGQPKSGKTTSDSLGIGALNVSDCFSKTSNRAVKWDALLFPKITERDAGSETRRLATVTAGKNEVGRNQWQNSHHNAIDRWTGGVVEHHLFQVLEPHEEDWNAIVLELDVDRMGKIYIEHTPLDAPDADKRRRQVIVLLLLVLRDLSKGRIPIGFGGNRGLGQVKVGAITVEPVEGTPLGLSGSVTMSDGRLSAFGEVMNEWKIAWQELTKETTNA